LFYGVNLPIFAEYSDARVLAARAHDAEEAGWDGFFLWDHMATPWGDSVVDPWVALTAAAMSTRRIKIGLMVTPLPRRRPWKVARETASLDRLSGGRLIMGVGLGAFPQEFENLGEPFDPKVRAAMLDEALDVLVGLWKAEPFSYNGEHYQIRDAMFAPPPLQQPRMPVWVAGAWPNKAPFRRAARWDGAFPIKVNPDGQLDMMSPGDVRDMVGYIREHRTGTRPYDVIVAGSTPGEAGQDADIIGPYAEAGTTWWHEGINPDRWGTWDPPWPTREMRERILKGPPKP
jgi:probable F420-dependent oxidoreductase